MVWRVQLVFLVLVLVFGDGGSGTGAGGSGFGAAFHQIIKLKQIKK